MQWNSTQKRTARRLIANMIGDKDRTIEMGETWAFKPDDFPSDMYFEAKILDILYLFRKDKIQPSFENIYNFLLNEQDHRLKQNGEFEEYIQTELNNLANEGTFDRAVTPLVHTLRHSLKHQFNIQIVDKMREIVLNEKYSDVDQYELLAKEFRKLSPRVTKNTSRNTTGLIDEWLEHQAYNIDIQNQGGFVGPRLPWKNTWKMLPYMRQREITLMAANTGFGKTTIGVLIGDYIAHEMGGFDVVYAHVETDPKVLANRLIAGKIECPVNELDMGWYHDQHGNKRSLDMREEPHYSKIKNVWEYIDDRQRTHGEMIYLHAPGVTIANLKTELEKYKLQAESRNRRFVVIIDYFQRMNWRIYSNDTTQGLNTMADELKLLAEDLNGYFIVLAQDKYNNSYDNDDPEIRGGNQIATNSQNVIRIERKIADGDGPRLVDGKARLDYLGRPIFYHRQGKFDSRTQLRVTKSNNNETKASSEIIIWNGYFKITERTQGGQLHTQNPLMPMDNI